MKTHVTETSINAFHGQDLSGQRLEVFKAIQSLSEACISDIAAYLNIERSSVAARLNELKKCDAIVYVEKRKSSRTGIMSEVYRARFNGEQIAVRPKSINNVSAAARVLAQAKQHKHSNLKNHPTLF